MKTIEIREENTKIIHNNVIITRLLCFFKWLHEITSHGQSKEEGFVMTKANAERIVIASLASCSTLNEAISRFTMRFKEEKFVMKGIERWIY
jgi:hypothetical protein